jgi:hypothetical protein
MRVKRAAQRRDLQSADLDLARGVNRYRCKSNRRSDIREIDAITAARIGI